MSKTCFLAFCALCLAMQAAISTAAPEQKTVAFDASVKVEVDATGKAITIQAPEALPESVRAVIEKRVAAWQYEPATRNGAAMPSTTYVRVGVCAVPGSDDNHVKVGVDFKGNGPRVVNALGLLPRPMYPGKAYQMRVEGAFEVTIAVKPQGMADIESITALKQGGQAKGEFEAALRSWVDRLTFEPEIVAGRPITTRLRIPVDFTLSRAPSPVQSERENLKKSECMAAAGSSRSLDVVVLDSPVKVITAPSG